MAKSFKIPPSLLLTAVLVIAAAELAAGTGLYFVTMVVIALLAAGLTYNMLGGIGTISGIGYCGFALNGLVISQFAKAFLFEPADQGLNVPELTITVYAIYYISLMVGTFLFGWIRLRLPRPLEPATFTHSNLLYAISFCLGLPATVALAALNLAGSGAEQSGSHGLAMAFANLLPFSLVVAVDHRISSTGGRHIFGWLALWPTLAMMFLGLVADQRGPFLQPAVIVCVTAYLRQYRFRARHYAAGLGIAVVFFLFISPYFLYARGFRGGSVTYKEEASKMFRLVASAPSRWQMITAAVESSVGAGGRPGYFSQTSAVTLGRFAMIAPDSTLINACSRGFHYGFISMKLDIRSQIPHILYKNKPDAGSGMYLGHLDGMESDSVETTHSTITPVADSYGAFGWMGVVLFPLIVVPAIFVVYESVFDMNRPWGTIAAVSLLFGLVAGSMGSTIMGTMIKTPLSLVLVSWFLGWIIRMLPLTGDQKRVFVRERREAALGESASV